MKISRFLILTLTLRLHFNISNETFTINAIQNIIFISTTKKRKSRTQIRPEKKGKTSQLKNRPIES